jgi:hypothetical protein
MFTYHQNVSSSGDKANKPKTVCENAKYKNIITSSDTTESSYFTIDNILENEKITNKNETWNKLDKTVKIQKLHIFSEKYRKEHNIPIKEIKNLKMFFNESLDKNKYPFNVNNIFLYSQYCHWCLLNNILWKN